LQIVALEEKKKERLNEVLALISAKSLVTHVGVERIPIDLAQFGKGPAGSRRPAVTGG
jgi:hypothetical protein